ncbi:MAG TPA: DUF5916 domain-containing protein [Gemmatimonadaceae bacterium]|nr:DUF5916 domain-containing protein [Gemmatimonadaceae bacterium]
MLLPLLALLQAGVAGQPVYNGRAGQLDVHIPRVAAEVTIDGMLDEAPWRKAAILTGFSTYQPVDGRPAPDSTEVLVWYSPTAIYFGIRAFEPHGNVVSTLADRDHIDADDNVQLLLDTFDDHRRAYSFSVNPLGVQADGTKSEGGGFGPGHGFGGDDLSSDFIWQSKGQLTTYGYQVEVRVPFTSLRYPTSGTQNWAVNVVRKVQHSGYEDTWTPALKGRASFLAQSGTLVGLTDLHRALVLQANPETTTHIEGTPASDGWSYSNNPQLGGNVKWGVTSNLTLNGTIKPDFSQVEADAGQIAQDPRFALFFDEKRPFFVDGIEQFDVPNQLIYTRRIVQPVGAVKLTGKVGRTNLALLSAVDDNSLEPTGEHPIVNIVRLRRDVGTSSTMGLVYTGRVVGSDYSRMAGGDIHLVFGKLYYAQFQAVASVTREAGSTIGAPLWEGVFDRTGRSFGFHYTITGIGQNFAAADGFVPRTGFVNPSIMNRVTIFGAPGSALETWTLRSTVEGTWKYNDFFAGRSVLEDQASVRNELTFRGGWQLDVTPSISSFAFDPASYTTDAVQHVTAAGTDTLPFVVPPRITTYGLDVQGQTPQFQNISASLSATLSRDVDFFETTPVRRMELNGSVDYRPTTQLRVSASYASSVLRQWDDGRTVAKEQIPRLKIEYQLSRPIFLRFVGQYDAQQHEALRDPRTGEPILLLGDSGYVQSTATHSNDFRVDLLFSYRPIPGTVFFAGYGSSLTETRPLAFDGLHRVTDGFFLKLSYLFRL